ncbi:MAG: YebC/PmpR family DNA-binding transcriptional regulator [Bacilli bacterium]|nr:YebC/PmpR family DNA-binding transcriptional regulator [Bacilli bacterium]
MGRAYEVRKASIQKTGAAKAKIYSMYAREIYQAAKNGGTEIEGNPSLKRLVEKAKKEQVPNDIVKRAIDKVNSGADETYTQANYEIFGPSGSTAIAVCLTDNVNRSVSSVRAVINKCHVKMGAQGSVSYMYDHLSIVSFKGLDEEETLELLIEEGIDVTDIEKDGEETVVYGEPNDLYKIKEAISKKLPGIEFDMDEITMIPKEKVTLTGEDLDTFKRMLSLLDEVEDVQTVYHNVELSD